jgi:NAD dependent epimerase/dehydratase family enzyme
MSWIHVKDLARAVTNLLENPAAKGVFNLVSPHPARQKEVTSAIEEILGPPARLRPPSFAARLVVGEMADLVLFSHRASASKLEATGFSFEHTDIRETLRKILA